MSRTANLESILRNYPPSYVSRVRSDVTDTVTKYSGLTVIPEAVASTIPGREPETLISLQGTIPTAYRGNVYHTKVHFRIFKSYPNAAPMAFVVPTPTISIKPRHKHVDSMGKCYFPYITDWKSASSSITGLIQVMVLAFSEDPPTFAIAPTVPAHPPSMAASHYPGSGSFTYPGTGAPAYPPSSSAGTLPGYSGSSFSSSPAGSVFLPAPAPAPAPAAATYEDALTKVEKMKSDAKISAGSSTTDEEDESKLCSICMTEPKTALFLPCAHICTCESCANSLHSKKAGCPICRQSIDRVQRVYIV
eukprot:TRINITY_DN500_c0_g1_i3.p1 TRINITY_DN500_c0_g1~~TRINITY_DN500_c0_g1_i3.p1  ORF type:complete len:305 (+),score=-12.25 TRINITY_DN500_c0_g1_i3:59-973(+)